MKLPSKQGHSLGKYIQKKRIEAGLTQRELAKLLDYTPQFITNWEVGKSSPPVRVIPLLVKILKIDEDEIFTILTEISMSYWRELLDSKKAPKARQLR